MSKGNKTFSVEARINGEKIGLNVSNNGFDDLELATVVVEIARTIVGEQPSAKEPLIAAFATGMGVFLASYDDKYRAKAVAAVLAVAKVAAEILGKAEKAGVEKPEFTDSQVEVADRMMRDILRSVSNRPSE